MGKDKILEYEDSILQHGPSNDRVYIMKLAKANTGKVLKKAESIASDKGYGKIFAKVPKSSVKVFKESGFELEASVPGFYKGQEDGAFLSKYLDGQRSKMKDPDNIKKIIQIASARKPKKLSLRHTVKALGEKDSKDLAKIYAEVFESYPFPVHDPSFLKNNMRSHVSYFGIYQDGKLVSVSSSEKDPKSRSVEMTDFATLPEYRGKKFALQLLKYMDQQMRSEGFCTAYTIARAKSPSMNVTFGNAGYIFSGTLKNNTNISGSIESMNIWYKSLMGAK